jgi:hypothetical protein
MLSNNFLLLIIIITTIIILICDDNKKIIEGITFKWYDENNQVLGTDYTSCINGISKLIKSRAQTNPTEIFRPSDYNNIQTCANKFNQDTDVVQKALVTKFSREAIDRVYSDKLSDSEIYETQGENEGEIKQEIQNMVDSNYNNQSLQCVQQEGSQCPTTCENKENECSNCTDDCLKVHKYIRDKTVIDEEWGDTNNPIPRKYYTLKKDRRKAVRQLAQAYIETYGENVRRGQNLSLTHCIGADSETDETCQSKDENQCKNDTNCVLYKSAPCAGQNCTDDETSNFSHQNLINKRNQIFDKINNTRNTQINEYRNIIDIDCDQAKNCRGPNATGDETEEQCTGDGKTWIGNNRCMPELSRDTSTEQIINVANQKLNQSYQNQNNINTFREILNNTSNCGGVCMQGEETTSYNQANCNGDGKTWTPSTCPSVLSGDLNNVSTPSDINTQIRQKLTELNSVSNQDLPSERTTSTRYQTELETLHIPEILPSCSDISDTVDADGEDLNLNTPEGKYHCDGVNFIEPRTDSSNLSILEQKTQGLVDKIAEYKTIEERHGVESGHLSEYVAKINGAAESVAPSGDDGHTTRIIQLDTHIQNTTSLRENEMTLNCLSGGGDVPSNQSLFGQLGNPSEITLSDTCRTRINEKLPRSTPSGSNNEVDAVTALNIQNARIALTGIATADDRPSWAVQVFESNNITLPTLTDVSATQAAEPAQAEPAQAEPAQAGCTGTTVGGSFDGAAYSFMLALQQSTGGNTGEIMRMRSNQPGLNCSALNNIDITMNSAIQNQLNSSGRRNVIASRLSAQQPNIFPSRGAALQAINDFRNSNTSNDDRKAIMCNFVRGCTHNSR